ncbi:MAG: DUF5658 family protein, partial [Gemmatimonadota bacterium]|nr:DUF5658 family protein [Gemmatimonadota bacterium]
PLMADWRWAHQGRRRTVRRDSDDGFVQPDHIHPRIAAAVIAVVVLSAMDAYFTLHLIRAGVVSEANPIMRFFIDTDPQMFINVKTAFTAGALMFLAVCSSLRVFSRLKVESILYGVLGLYVALIGYHLTLLARTNLL